VGSAGAPFSAEDGRGAGGALAAIMTALLVQKVSSSPLGLEDGDARLAP
jgi:hypothetical protein